ncbi:MAG TPA: DUF4013 domain-containing protein, partial [Candidatus Nanoarchaeia archaeon]|nr:DUF4013 domain-containing protein [Candidatus Nanoarchaeia archaeon]
IGMALYVVPILNIVTGIFVGGYLFRCMQTALRGEQKLPEWSQWGQLFIKGLLMALIGIIYAMPVIILVVFVAGATLAGVFVGGNDIREIFAALGMLVFLILFLVLLISYVVPGAMLQFAKTERFGAAFALGMVGKTLATSQYFTAWITVIGLTILTGIIAALAAMALSITIIGPMIVYAFLQIVMGIISMTLFGSVERQA